MSAAADRPIRLRLGTRVAVLGSLLVVSVWLAAALGWMRERQASLDAAAAGAARSLSGSVLRSVSERLAQPPISLDQALIAASAREAELAALRETRRGRRLVDEPDLPALVREQLEIALLRLQAVDAAWLRQGSRFDWAPRGTPRLDGPEPLDGPCLLRAPGGLRLLARCRESALPGEPSPSVAGAARRVDLSDLPGRPGQAAWALVVDEPDGGLLGEGGWPLQGEAERRLAASEAPLVALAAGRGWGVEASRHPGLGARLLVATAPPLRLSPLALARGDAGPLTSEWRRWSGRTGAVAIVALLFFAFLGWRVNAAFRPVLSAARSLGADDLDARVPVRRSDEIGALAAVLDDLGTSLKHARRNWEREARLAAWRDVARGLAHEIKNPLTPIRGTVENLLRWRSEEPARFDEKFEARMGTILEEVEQLSRLASAFSDFAKLPPPQREDCDLNALLRDVASLQLGDRAGLVLDDRLDEALGPQHLDPGQLRQVATNLLKNAREALGEKGGGVRLESGPLGAGAWFAVSDDGPGVDAASLERLFVPGWSTRKAEGGSGLGLWLCHRIVLEHGGTIEAGRSELGGLRIRVALPER